MGKPNSQYRDANRRKWLHPPTWGQINRVIRKLKTRPAAFERFYGLPPTTLSHVKIGKRPLPIEYWHIIFEFEDQGKNLTAPLTDTKAKKTVSTEIANQLNQFKKQ